MFCFESPNRSDQSHTLQLHRWTAWNKHMVCVLKNVTLKSQGMFFFLRFVFWGPAWRLTRFNMRPYSLVEQLDTQKFETLPPPKKKTMQGDMADSAKWNGRLFLHPIYPPNDSGLVMKIPQLKSGSFFGAWCSNMLRICKSCANPAEVVREARGRLGVTNEESPGRIQWWKSRVSLAPKVGCSRWKVWGLMIFVHHRYHSAMCCLHLLCIQIAEPTRFCHALPLQISYFRAPIYRRYYSKCIQIFKSLKCWFQFASTGFSWFPIIPDLCKQKESQATQSAKVCRLFPSFSSFARVPRLPFGKGHCQRWREDKDRNNYNMAKWRKRHDGWN